MASWWLTPEAQTSWTNQLGDVPANPKAQSNNPVNANILSQIGEYTLYQRYWEASPVPIVEGAVDFLAQFMLNPGDAESVLQQIQDLADRLGGAWRTERRRLRPWADKLALCGDTAMRAEAERQAENDDVSRLRFRRSPDSAPAVSPKAMASSPKRPQAIRTLWSRSPMAQLTEPARDLRITTAQRAVGTGGAPRLSPFLFAPGPGVGQYPAALAVSAKYLPELHRLQGDR